VEIDHDAADALCTEPALSRGEESPGFHVTCVDFLECRAPAHCAGLPAVDVRRLGYFDLILQNAPYQKGQALKHFEHALTFLLEDGVLAAIVPQNFPEAFEGWEIESQPIPAGAFKES